MSEITIFVSKDELLDKLKENRKSHRALYEKAWEGYCKLVRQELEDKLDRIKKSKPIDRYLGHTPPEDHSGDYDDVIDMMKMALDDKVELTQPQFKQYVKDDWGWKAAWTTSNTPYIEASR